MVPIEINAVDMERAKSRMLAEREAGYAIVAEYESFGARLILEMSTGIAIAVPVRLLEGLADGNSDDLSVIEISGSGLGLH